ncbi:hypothetical protein D3C71_1814780 [compost metagenome]
MSGEFVPRHLGAHHLEHPAGGTGGARADGVAQGDFVAAHGIQLPSDPSHLFRLDRTFIRAAQHAGHVTAHTDAVLFCGLHDRCETLQAVLDGAVDIALGERFGRGGEHRHFFYTRR